MAETRPAAKRACRSARRVPWARETAVGSAKLRLTFPKPAVNSVLCITRSFRRVAAPAQDCARPHLPPVILAIKDAPDASVVDPGTVSRSRAAAASRHGGGDIRDPNHRALWFPDCIRGRGAGRHRRIGL